MNGRTRLEKRISTKNDLKEALNMDNYDSVYLDLVFPGENHVFISFDYGVYSIPGYYKEIKVENKEDILKEIYIILDKHKLKIK